MPSTFWAVKDTSTRPLTMSISRQPTRVERFCQIQPYLRHYFLFGTVLLERVGCMRATHLMLWWFSEHFVTLCVLCKWLKCHFWSNFNITLIISTWILAFGRSVDIMLHIILFIFCTSLLFSFFYPGIVPFCHVIFAKTLAIKSTQKLSSLLDFKVISFARPVIIFVHCHNKMFFFLVSDYLENYLR